MTLQEIEKMDVEYLIPEQVGEILGCNAYSINVQVRDNPAELGFPTVKIGSRVKIPRLAFIRFMKGELPITGRGCRECNSDLLYEQVKQGNQYCKCCGRRLPHIDGVEYLV